MNKEDDVLNLIDIEKIRGALKKAYPLISGNETLKFPKGICHESSLFVLYLLWLSGHSAARLVHIKLPNQTSHWLTCSHDPYTRFNEIDYAIDLTIDQFVGNGEEPGVFRKIPAVFFETSFKIYPLSISIQDFQEIINVFKIIYYHYFEKEIYDCENFIKELIANGVYDPLDEETD